MPKLNEQKTYENVTNFFKRDLERIVLMSGSRMTDLASPNLNGAPGSSNFNNVEINLINGLDAQNIVKSVNDALHYGVDPVSKKILIGLYINHQRWVDIQPLIYREHTSFSVYRKHALISFAY
ncbi:ArpU family phage packaging/lysis transcriptional regulator, partial [Lactobacillus intestinalis]|uniref:ArpU family phage packaging/lysis transcriptional regulator n=1 Tax=Lactobacillus intestinalis TaxID=151781 RepID=UPI003EB7FFAB